MQSATQQYIGSLVVQKCKYHDQEGEICIIFSKKAIITHVVIQVERKILWNSVVTVVEFHSEAGEIQYVFGHQSTSLEDVLI